MTIKIDMEKAYDRLHWSFIEDTLEDSKIPNNVIYLIMKCVSTYFMKVL